MPRVMTSTYRIAPTSTDSWRCRVKADLIEVIRENPEYGEYAADLLLVNKYLERIGDHATNIAEWVIFALNSNGDANEY